ncbi:hypothetical protein U3A58_18080 [Algoriphagus sp. C2-6-M1]|uniref:hypothetical protein n=1 Tax=Algoriphagus persicinus TaxID=3108754 RepID=UPI002B3C0BE6|nr:hypothetical protein [Algoriphagus sp. C2-6-M1]MEB2782304.1 hypothetical protein [Algoriphagus sp. C2-6-M1]
MAEIKIEKKTTPVWPWILVALAVIALLIYLFAFNGDGDENDEMNEITTEEPADTRQVAPNNSTVVEFVSFIEEDPDQMGLDHEYTNEALLKLTNATEAMANEAGYDTQQDITLVRTLSEKVTTDPFETTHANSIKEAADILAQTLQNIQQNAFSGLSNEANAVKSAAAEIETDVLTLDQKEDVKNFFRKAANLLEKMNTNSPEI